MRQLDKNRIKDDVCRCNGIKENIQECERVKNVNLN